MMIYLIDDKKSRQAIDFGWGTEKLNKFSHILKPIYSYNEIRDREERKEIFSENNVILFHESFFDNPVNQHAKDSVEIRNDLTKHATDGKGWVVFFSGSKNSRKLEGRVAYIPVSVLYKNLSDFIEKASENEIDLRYILYGGKSPEIEERLLDGLLAGNNTLDETLINTNKKAFLALSGNRQDIPINIEKAIEKTLSQEEQYDNQITDRYLNDKIQEWLDSEEYEKIFIPLCFGSILSDYNGLRLAGHIRCTNTINRVKPIYIYSFVDYSSILENEYFDILKTKNVFLINYTRNAFVEAINKEIPPLAKEELPKEIRNFKLNVPKNYNSSHGIANEWAIYKLVCSLPEPFYDSTEKVLNNFENDIYFKYLQTAFPILSFDCLNNTELKINHSFDPKKQRVLYIDNDYSRGWGDIFDYIFNNINKFDFNIFTFDFNTISREDIVESAYNEIIDLNTGAIKYDVILLDFRLCQEDSGEPNVDSISGMQILRKLKKHNPGIQVVVFSATNKVQNLQAIHDAGADAFIMKEGPENVADRNFTKLSTLKLIQTVKDRLSLTFLKEAYVWINQIKNDLDEASNPSKSVGFDKLSKIKLKNEIRIQLDISYECLRNSNKSISSELKEDYSYFNLSYISLFKVIELINDYFTDEKGDHLKFKNLRIMKYRQKSTSFEKVENGKHPTTADKIIFIYKHELGGAPIDISNKITSHVRNRNNIVHPRDIKDYKKTNQHDNLDFLKLINQITSKLK